LEKKMQQSTPATEVFLTRGKTNVKPALKRKPKTSTPKKGRSSRKNGRLQKDVSVAIAPGLHLRTTKKGKKRWVLFTQHERKQYRKVIGDAEVMPQAEAEAIAQDASRRLRLGESEHTVLPASRVFSAAGAALMEAYSRHWKPITHAGSLRAFDYYLLPWFGDMPIEEITRQDVLNWFDSMHAKPGAANRSLPLLSTIMQQAELYGFRPEGSNPCTKIKRYRLQSRECFLMPSEIRTLGRVLSEQEKECKKKRDEVTLIRLLILTGCRKGELLNLQWSSYRDGHLHLPDSKTGPKMIYLSTPARQILDDRYKRRRKKRPSKWVFPGRTLSKPLVGTFLWYKVRKLAGMDKVRLHDLRHSYASTAIHHGVDLRTLGMLLGHQDTDTTLQYVHLCDDAVFASVQIIGDALSSRGNSDV
jgi:integrase